MKHHVQNPWTRNPQVFVHLTVEEVQQLRSALSKLLSDGRATAEELGLNREERHHALNMLGHLDHACEVERPHGISGAMP